MTTEQTSDGHCQNAKALMMTEAGDTSWPRGGALAWAVHVASVVWQHVVPVLVADATAAAATTGYSRYGACAWLVGVGEGVWPLSGLACGVAVAVASRAWSSLAGPGCAGVGHSGRYYVLTTAASVTGDPRSRCVSWLLRNIDCRGTWKKSRRHKETMSVMFGLCIGGHLSAAKSFFESGDAVEPRPEALVGRMNSPGLVWDRRPGSELMQDVKSGYFGEFRLLTRVCSSGNLEMLQWATSTFGINQPWEMLMPLRAALSGGHLEVAKWILTKFPGLTENLQQQESSEAALHLAMACGEGKDPQLVKWFLGQVPFPTDYLSASLLFRPVLCNPRSTLELCQWMKSHLDPSSQTYVLPITGIKNREIRHWAATTFPEQLTNTSLSMFCHFGQDLDFATWLVSERKFRPTPNDFEPSCCNYGDNVEFPKWVSSQVHLSPEDHKRGLLSSLSRNNTRIANWLEETYSVMNGINSQGSSCVAKALLEICKVLTFGEEKLAGIEWFVARLTAAELDSDSALEVLDQAATAKRHKSILFIIKAFHIQPSNFVSNRRRYLLAKLLQCVAQWSLSAVKELTSLLPFSSEDVAHALSSDRIVFLCSDVVRWLAEQYHLTASHIKANHNVVLYQLILSNKNSCAGWLIDYFGICLEEVVDMFMKWGQSNSHRRLYLSTWRMILNKFPELSCDTTWRIMPRVSNLPCIAEYTLGRYHIEEEMAQRLLAELWRRCINVSDEFQLWKAALV
ncbi:hypothetical protein Pelo_14894 [Pelomyxa schiedti]|nr:hypothetical protein Pelo_14894 [Pelomyxa schiedti]